MPSGVFPRVAAQRGLRLQGSVKGAAGRWLLRWLRFGLGLDALFFLILVAAGLALGALTWDRFIRDPRLESVVLPAAIHLGGVASAVAAMPPAEREAFLKELVQRSDGAVALDDPRRPGLEEPATVMASRSMVLLRELLPDQVLAYSSKGGNMLWLALPGDSPEGGGWLRVNAGADDRAHLRLFVAIVSGVVLLVLACAVALLLQTRKRVHGWASSSLSAAPLHAALQHQEAVAHLHALDAQASSAARERLAELEQLCRRLSEGAAPAAAAPAPGHSPLVRRWMALRGWLRVDFMADVATILVLLGLVLAALGWTFDRLIVQPRFEAAADFFAVQIRGVRTALEVLPPQRREAFLDDISRISRGRIEVDDPARWQLAPPKIRYLDHFVTLLRERLPGIRLHTTSEPHRLLWFSLGPGTGAGTQAGDEVSLRFQAPAANNHLLLLVRGIFVAMLVIALAVVWRGRQRAERLMSTLEHLDDIREGPRSSSPDEDVEVAQLAMAADPRLRASVEQAIRQREVGELDRVDLVRRARACTEQLRRLRPPGGAGVAFDGHLEPIDRWIAGFDPHEAAADSREPAVVDINEVMARVSRYAAAPVRVEQGGVPYVNLRPSVALRLFQALLDGLAPDFAVGVDITSTMEHGWVVVRVRNPLGDACEAQLLAREGIAAACQLASAHGGALRLSPLAEGGWQAEVRFPCARLD